ncbi:cell division protein ZapA [bacterium]|nr:cell division protein ZapA [bacterium]
MGNPKRTIVINIGGREYILASSVDEDYAFDVARYVDAKFREVSAQNTGSPPAKLAILTALNIADELFRERKKSELASFEDAEKLKKLYQKLSQALTEE